MCLETTGNTPPGTSGAEALIFQQKLYIFGGHTVDGNTAELYCLDLLKREWMHLPVENRADQPAPRDKHKGWVYGNRCFFPRKLLTTVDLVNLLKSALLLKYKKSNRQVAEINGHLNHSCIKYHKI